MDDETSVLERILDGAEEPTDLPLALLKRITNDFSEERKIGQGGFGEVYKGKLGEKIVAVKRIHINENTFDDKLFRQEFVSLWNTKHLNIIRFLGFCSNTHQKTIEDAPSGGTILANVLERLLCFEYISNGSLDKHITDELRGLEWETRYEIITGICKGLRYLHKEKRIIHMDLKPANILLHHQDGKYMVPKITDFGLSRINENSHTVGTRFGTRGYMAPEYEKYGKTTFMSDIYSLGAIIIELVTGFTEVPNKDNVLRRWRHRWNTPPTQLQYQQVTRCINIAVRCKEQEPEARPSISEIIRFLSQSKSTCGPISPCLDEDDILGIKLPKLELRLPSDLKNEISRPVQLTNGTRNRIAFNIQVPSTQYKAEPVKGIVKPGSMYVVTITVQAKGVHQHNHADKLTVQSMPASEGLRDEDITEGMSRAEARKVVDEVDFMVVYETTKPQENCNRRKDINTAAEEVSETEQKKIVESASGKGKLGSGKNAEAASMDINSSGQRQCVRPTEHCRLHTLQSFSRHYPTERKYLVRESDRAVDRARGAMGSLLDKLGKLVTEDYNLEKSMKREIESFSEDLTIMHRDLPKMEHVDGAKIWVDEVRELSYHIEDMVDSFLVHVEPDFSRNGFRELRHEGLQLWENGMMTHHQIVDVIRDIKEKVQVVADRQKKYNFDFKNVVANATAEDAIDDLRNLAMYENKEELIGIEAARNEVIGLLEGDGDVSEQNLRIVSIVGLGGLGKTTLANAVYEKLQAQYHTRAFVPVGRNPDLKNVLKNIISELESGFKAKTLDVGQLIEKLKELLKNKSYFIVIDDLWDSEASLPSQKKEAWSFIKYVFPRNKHGSRVITTTRNHDVALACCNGKSKYVYRIKPLSAEESERLFFRRSFGPQKDCPVTPRKVSISYNILERCGGMPLAINSIASLLAGKPETTWEYVWKSLGALTEGHNGLENVTQILDLSYIHLPAHLKTCLLYVCKYPEDREIDKNDLLMQWVAEGFVSTAGGQDAVDVAEEYFKKLINVCMIQPERIDYNNEVLSCRVHDIILDLMRSKSTEENFIRVIDGLKDVPGPRGEICRVSVQNIHKEDSNILATTKGSLAHVRSVLLYRRFLLHEFLEFKYVRVLHLEGVGCEGYYLLDLTSISGLFLLRYLKIVYPGIWLKLPNRIGELQQLETIDLEGRAVGNYPSDIASLPRLLHLSFGCQEVALPDGIGRLKSLRTLQGVGLYESTVDCIMGLGELTNLRKLDIRPGSVLVEEEMDVRMNALQYSVSRLSTSLRILTFEDLWGDILDHKGWSRSLFPRGSHIGKLDLCGCVFQSCPKWIGQLHDLYSLRITVWEVADAVSIVARLPSLAYFSLCVYVSDKKEEKEESVVISGSGAFQALKHLVFLCKKASLTFEHGALPNLEMLDILFRFLPVGIEHLPAPTLKHVYIGVSTNDLVYWQVKGWHWDNRAWDLHWSSDDYYDKLKELKRESRILLNRAFKLHHPSADIHINFPGQDYRSYSEYADSELSGYSHDDEDYCDQDYYCSQEDDANDEEDYDDANDEESSTLALWSSQDRDELVANFCVDTATWAVSVRPQHKAVDDDIFWDNLVTTSDEGAEDNNDDASQDVFWDNLLMDSDIEGEAAVGQA